jgi:LEA14-like dessication related protein
MRRPLVLLLLPVLALAAAPPLHAETARRPVGSVQRLEVTSLTRQKALLWFHVALPHAARGASQKFTGKLELANVEIPFHQPARVMVQPTGGSGADAVFFVDVDLSQVPETLLGRAGAQALDPVFDGTLTGEAGDTALVFAAGVLRFGTPEVRTPSGVSPEFLRFGEAHLTDVSLSETSGEASVILFNPFSFTVPIRELSYQLYVGDRLLASGVKRAVRIKPRQESRVDLPVTARNVDLAAAAGSAILSGGTLEGRLLGAITLKVATGDIVVPINVPGRVEVGR